MNIQSISVSLLLADTKFLHSISEIPLPKLENSAKTKSFFLNAKIDKYSKLKFEKVTAETVRKLRIYLFHSD